MTQKSYDTYQGRRKVWKSEGSGNTAVGIICPTGWDRVDCSAKNRGGGTPQPPACDSSAYKEKPDLFHHSVKNSCSRKRCRFKSVLSKLDKQDILSYLRSWYYYIKWNPSWQFLILTVQFEIMIQIRLIQRAIGKWEWVIYFLKAQYIY